MVMGNFIKNKIKNSPSKPKKLDGKRHSVSMGHKAIVLTPADVKARRSNAYTYLPL